MVWIISIIFFIVKEFSFGFRVWDIIKLTLEFVLEGLFSGIMISISIVLVRV